MVKYLKLLFDRYTQVTKGPILQSINFDAAADIYDSYVITEFDLPFWLTEAKSVKALV
jgi:hypothetical protein